MNIASTRKRHIHVIGKARFSAIYIPQSPECDVVFSPQKVKQNPTLCNLDDSVHLITGIRKYFGHQDLAFYGPTVHLEQCSFRLGARALNYFSKSLPYRTQRQMIEDIGFVVGTALQNAKGLNIQSNGTLDYLESHAKSKGAEFYTLDRGQLGNFLKSIDEFNPYAPLNIERIINTNN